MSWIRAQSRKAAAARHAVLTPAHISATCLRRRKCWGWDYASCIICIFIIKWWKRFATRSNITVMLSIKQRNLQAWWVNRTKGGNIPHEQHKRNDRLPCIYHCHLSNLLCIKITARVVEEQDSRLRPAYLTPSCLHHRSYSDVASSSRWSNTTF